MEEHALGVLNTFCYLGDTVSERGGCNGRIQRVRSAWEKFRKLLQLSTNGSIHIKTSGKFSMHVYNVLLYGSECCALGKKDKVRLERNDRAMLRWLVV